ncbi:ABC transporter ATP-binding protein [Paenibacillus odorifer]|uniref:ABC transporter ATP-binding protein n=1 Tax=Paenibacillus odorifer TaxID=189426 RepID=UPI0004F7781C|nr:ABC transporter ATP-binding protein [Paenibacillus odorifer]AIQ75846.1 peptide ABC transporter ATP-binding protein [Paenibacillus odorifer]
MSSLLRVSNLQVVFNTDHGEVISVDQINFNVNSGETVGIVGESGCGKSVTSLAIMRLLSNNGKITNGNIFFEDSDLAAMSESKMQRVRGKEIAMVFQEPMTALNPVFTIGNQMIEGVRNHLKMSVAEARKHCIATLKEVGISRAESIMKDYPHALSGGMRQRVMIAMAVSCSPKLIVADEPTTALDVTIQAQILDLMNRMKEQTGAALILITHDLGVVAEMADKVIVMYAGQVVEEADVYQLFASPLHPYTQGLMQSIPHLDNQRETRLESIPGSVPSIQEMPTGCRFQSRCSKVHDKCQQAPPLYEIGTRKARCWLVESMMKETDADANE